MTESRGPVLALVGGQYGSEGKGAIARLLANEFGVHIRSGGPNAGHSFTHLGRRWAMQQVPCGWINPRARLVLTPGSLISLEVLKREVDAIEEYESTRGDVLPSKSIWDRLVVDSHAGIIAEEHRAEAGGVDGEAHKRYGSTGEGVGVARIARIQRKGFMRAEDAAKDHGWLENLLYDDTVGLVNDHIASGVPVMLEGTQGTGLSMIHGSYPYVTNHDTGSAQMLADAGIAPQLLTDTVVVLRTFPIRVAGNSGPLSGEMSWEEMASITGIPNLVEHTTVTKKPRRIGRWDWELARRAVLLNKPSGLALTFLDYLFPESVGIDDYETLTTRAPNAVAWVNQVELQLGVRAWFLGTGPDILIDRRPALSKRPGWESVNWASGLGIGSY